MIVPDQVSHRSIQPRNCVGGFAGNSKRRPRLDWPAGTEGRWLECSMFPTMPYGVCCAKEGIQLRCHRSWCVSTDPEFAAKAADVIGLYLSPPQNALVLSVDEKPSIQAPERETGYVYTSSGKVVRGLKSTYKRHGTINLFAALNVATGKIKSKTTRTKKCPDFQDFTWQWQDGAWLGAGIELKLALKRQPSALATRLSVSASTIRLKPNETSPCSNTMRRIVEWAMPTSATCEVMPITAEKYAKSR